MGKAEFVILFGGLFIILNFVALIVGIVFEISEDIITFIRKRRASKWFKKLP